MSAQAFISAFFDLLYLKIAFVPLRPLLRYPNVISFH